MPEGRGLVIAACLMALPLVTPRLRGADEIECFAYLRSAVFDRDLDFVNEYTHFYERDPQGLAGFKATFLDRREPETGRPINFTPLGPALLWSPFYLAAHLGVLVARGLGAAVATDGYSLPYAAAACYASWLYGSLGLVLIHDTLRRYLAVPEPAAAWSVVALLWGTPVLYYLTLAPGFSHAASLFAVALLVWLTLRAGPRIRDWVAVGAALGLCGLVREQDGLFGVLPLGLLAVRTLRERDWTGGIARGLALIATAVLMLTPQLLAYRSLNGAYGPSRLVTRKMTYSSPHFLEVLFDPAHGLFVWAPLLLVAAAGLIVVVYRRRDAAAACVALALLVQIWINGSVESWSQAGAFGSRRFVAATALFAWGLATVLAALPPPRKALAAGALAVCVWWNVSLMVQFGLRLMDRQRLEWPRVAVNQVSEVPRRLVRVAYLFFTDRERLVREGA